MIRDRRLLIIPIAVLLLFMVIYFIYLGQRHSTPQPSKKPVPKQQVQTVKPNWYIQFTVKDQKSTAYTEATRAPISSAGKEYFIGSGAVHPRYPLNSGGEARSPIIPFGTTIYLNEPIEVQGQKITSLVINDTGDVYYGLWPSHPYWVDVYFGNTNYYNQQSASKAGVRIIDYSWYEPWPNK